MELGVIPPDSTPLLVEDTSGSSSLRSSLDSGFYQRQGCDIHIYDDTPSDQSRSLLDSNQALGASSWHGGLGSREELTQHLKVTQLRSKLNPKLTSARPEIRIGLDGCKRPSRF